jgi:4-amino-4-deoxy-L-arabinose transferase-like glycosyltransferase
MQTTPTTVSTSRSAAPARDRAWAWSWPRISGTTLYLAALIALGLALRLWFIAVNDIDPRFSAADDGDYFQRALRLAATGEYVDNSWLIRPPGHVFFFAGMLRLAIVFGDPNLGISFIRAAQVALSLALIPIGYDMARRLFSRQAGLIFALIMAIWFPMVELPALILSEPLFFSMLVIHAWLLVRWRDAWRNGARAWPWLAAAGVTLAVGALARSPALYSAVFVLAVIGWEAVQAAWARRDAPAQGGWGVVRSALRRFIPAALAFVLPFALVIAPWTVRNYVTYGEVVLIDTLGPVNLWIKLGDAVHEGRGENEAKAILAAIPQAERQAFVSADIRRIISEEPERLVRSFWPHFQHIWKAQFIEDYFVKVSFFTRPLREIWPIGLLGDALWLSFTTAAMLGLAARPREGGFRLLALGWIAYACLTVMLIHVEPRYLLPIWLFTALYGAAAFGALWNWLSLRRNDRPAARAQARAYLRSPWGVAGVALALAFLVLCFSYRNYPAIISQGIQRERLRAEALAALPDREAAIAGLERMVAVAPTFIDGRTELARLYLAEGDYDAGWAALGERPTHRSDVVRGALARAQERPELAAIYFEDAEVRAGEDVQKLAMEWGLQPPAHTIRLGSGVDHGYVQGFSFGERLPPDASGFVRSYRWLQGEGVIVVPLETAPPEGAVVRLQMAGSPLGDTPLTVTVNGAETTLLVRSNEWRSYRLTVPAGSAADGRIVIRLKAPTFIPVQALPGSEDARPLSLMVSSVTVE